jgi:hypothetical protein
VCSLGSDRQRTIAGRVVLLQPAVIAGPGIHMVKVRCNANRTKRFSDAETAHGGPGISARTMSRARFVSCVLILLPYHRSAASWGWWPIPDSSASRTSHTVQCSGSQLIRPAALCCQAAHRLAVIHHSGDVLLIGTRTLFVQPLPLSA